MTTEGKTNAEYHECYQTEVKTVKFEYKWIVSDFRSTFNKMKSLSAPSFAMEGTPITGHIGIHPLSGRCVNGSQTHARITVKFTRGHYSRLFVRAEVSVINSEGIKRLIFAKDFCGFEANHPYNVNANSFECSHDLSVDDLVPYTNLGGTTDVTLCCDVTMEMLSSAPSAMEPVIQVPMPECRSVYNFGHLLEDPKFSDVTITVGSKKFNVHRVVLANRSSVFAAMFDNKMKENESSNVDITDMSEEAVEEMLKFIYTDKTEKLGDMTNELLDAAEKYDLGTLKDLCVYSLRKNLNCSNAAESLILADRYNLTETKSTILKFINKHRKSVGESDGYKDMREKYPKLLVETFEVL